MPVVLLMIPAMALVLTRKLHGEIAVELPGGTVAYRGAAGDARIRPDGPGLDHPG